MKKKCAFVLFLLSICLLCGCSSLEGDRAETLKGWSFQYNKGTDDYSVFFGLPALYVEALSHI